MTQATTGNSQPSAAPHVIVIGAGFAGLYAVKSLRKAKFRVSLIDRNLYSTFQPLLYQVATGGLNPGDVSYAIGGYTGKYGARYLRGTLTGIDPGARRITLADGREMAYDYLILATGVSASHFGIKGAEEFTYGLYTRRDAVAFRDRLMADVEGLSEGAPGSVLDVTMVGGGATGVELAGTLAELRDTVLRGTFPDPRPARRGAVRAAHPVRPEAARLHPRPAGQARRGHPPGHRDRGGHARPGDPERRPGPAQ